jgi:hypothetical protein
VHGLNAGDRDRVALRDEVFRQRLRQRQGSGPGISVGVSSHSAYRTSRCDDSAHIETVLIHGGA